MKSPCHTRLDIDRTFGGRSIEATRGCYIIPFLKLLITVKTLALLKIFILHENFLANLLKKISRKDFFLLFFLGILIGR